MATIQEIALVLTIRNQLPHGSQVLIASRLSISRHNVQTALRGMAGMELTKKVVREADYIIRHGTEKYKKKLKRIAKHNLETQKILAHEN